MTNSSVSIGPRLAARGKFFRTSAVIGLLCVATLSLAGCGGSSRTVTAYCQYFYRNANQFLNGIPTTEQQVGQDPLGAIMNLISAPAQLANLFAGLEQHSPPGVEPSVATLAAAFKQTSSDASNAFSFGGLMKGLVDSIDNGVTTNGAMNTFNSYTYRNCGPPPGTKWLSN